LKSSSVVIGSCQSSEDPLQEDVLELKDGDSDSDSDLKQKFAEAKGDDDSGVNVLEETMHCGIEFVVEDEADFDFVGVEEHIADHEQVKMVEERDVYVPFL
jgi:hypothetical protein